ncbi:hypothetical protein NC797_08230 [Aquibacillus sp. 3ASR75-11]|uniref:Uncharacterized protein n=1 Tax=Terrihalobacillus insolitus TaxID=2950438 RepID=A0A9X4ALQ7_9BACI|nr:hypothetical protein [Terrihalobacillus insolitus]MDC3424496.1 hypothetical protein [Terrihalobacillus insolitus]
MSQNYYHTCCKSVGRPVAIRTHDGIIHRGIVHHVSRSHVILRPLPARGLGGYGFGYRRGYGRGGYGGYGHHWGISFAAIAALALLPFFFW